MAFPVVESSSTGSVSGGSQSPASKPTGLAVGDAMICGVVSAAYSGNVPKTDPPDGTWTILESGPVTSSYKITSYWKIATSADVAASSFAFASGASDRVVYILIRISGTDGGTPILAANRGASTGTNFSSSGITPVTQPLLLQITGATNNNTSGSGTISSWAIANSNPTWSTVNSTANSDTGNRAVLYIVQANMTGNANTATGNATAAIGSNFDVIEMQIIAIQPPIPLVSIATGAFVANMLTVPAVIISIAIAAFTALQPTVENIANIWGFRSKGSTSGSDWTPRSK